MSFVNDFDDPAEDGFQMPAGPPQMETEANRTIQQLLDEAPAFDQAYLPELLVLLRNHIVLRSMLMFALEKARAAELQLRTLDDPTQVFRAQGKVIALADYVETVQGLLTSMEQYRGKDETQ